MTATRLRRAAFGALAAAVLSVGLAGPGRALVVPDSTMFDGLVRFFIPKEPNPCPDELSEVWMQTQSAEAFDFYTLRHTFIDSTHVLVTVSTRPMGTWSSTEWFSQREGVQELGQRAAGKHAEFIELRITVPADSVSAGGVVVLHRRLDYQVSDTCATVDMLLPHVAATVIGSATCAGLCANFMMTAPPAAPAATRRTMCQGFISR